MERISTKTERMIDVIPIRKEHNVDFALYETSKGLELRMGSPMLGDISAEKGEQLIAKLDFSQLVKLMGNAHIEQDMLSITRKGEEITVECDKVLFNQFLEWFKKQRKLSGQ